MSIPNTLLAIDDGILASAKTTFTPTGTDLSVEMGNVTAISISAGSDEINRISAMTGTVGQSLNTIRTPTPATFSMTFDTFNRQNTAMAIAGVDSDIAELGVAIPDFTVTIKQLDRPHKTEYKNIDESSVVVLDDNGDIVPSEFVVVNGRLGYVGIKSGSTVVANTDITVQCSTMDAKGYRIAAAAMTSLTGAVRLVCENRATGKEFTIEAGNATMAPDGEFSWIGDDFLSATLSGTMSIDPKTGAPYVTDFFE